MLDGCCVSHRLEREWVLKIKGLGQVLIAPFASSRSPEANGGRIRKVSGMVSGDEWFDVALILTLVTAAVLAPNPAPFRRRHGHAA